jgi:DNA helicase-4
MGFPSKIQDAPILDLLLDNGDGYPHSEERRLFYVALTRAREKVSLLILKGDESEFVEEMRSVHGAEIKEGSQVCPLCGDHLIRRSGPYGEFFGCRSYWSQGCKYKKKI